jgi:hypothetical protein
MKRVLECRHDEPPLRQKQGGEWDELICCVLLPAATAVSRYAIIGATREYSLLSVSLSFSFLPSFSFVVHIVVVVQKRTVIALR